MFNRKNKSRLTPLASTARADRLGPLGLAWCVAVLFCLISCTTTTIPRLDATFNTDSLGGPPSSDPQPRPPYDHLTWALHNVTATVVANPAGGNWVRILPLAFTNLRKGVVYANSEPFNTTSPPVNIRGHFRLRLDNSAVVLIGFLPLQGTTFLDHFIAAIELDATSPIAHVDAYPPTNVSLIQDYWPFPNARELAEGPAGSFSGKVIEIDWSIDQGSHTFNASVPLFGAPAVSSTYDAVYAGVATSPIQTLFIEVFIQSPEPNTALFIDDLYAEEY